MVTIDLARRKKGKSLETKTDIYLFLLKLFINLIYINLINTINYITMYNYNIIMI